MNNIFKQFCLGNFTKKYLNRCALRCDEVHTDPHAKTHKSVNSTQFNSITFYYLLIHWACTFVDQSIHQSKINVRTSFLDHTVTWPCDTDFFNKYHMDGSRSWAWVKVFLVDSSPNRGITNWRSGRSYHWPMGPDRCDHAFLLPLEHKQSFVPKW